MSPSKIRKNPATRHAPARRRREPVSREDTSGTRQKVIDAAISCILEQGFYRASSNAIAEAAGLTWGVIQYYFGTREALMLAVIEEGNRRLTSQLADTKISGDTMEARLDQYFDVIEAYYGHPDYLAFIQALLNLGHDPRTSEQARETMIQAAAAIDGQLARLTEQLFAGTKVKKGVRNFPFHALRGLALSEVMLNTLPFDTADLMKRTTNQRRNLISAVALLLESEGVEISSE